MTARSPATSIEVATLWEAVVRAGGAVGFPENAPSEEIADAAAHVVRDVEAGREQLLVERDGTVLTGMVLLRRSTAAVYRHRAEVRKLMVTPDRHGAGTGGRLLARAIDHARGLGLRQLQLATRGGTHLPDFYRKRGWVEVGRFPRALQIAPGDFRDEYWFQFEL